MKHGHGVYIDFKISLCDYICFFNKQLATIWQIFGHICSVRSVFDTTFCVMHSLSL